MPFLLWLMPSAMQRWSGAPQSGGTTRSRQSKARHSNLEQHPRCVSADACGIATMRSRLRGGVERTYSGNPQHGVKKAHACWQHSCMWYGSTERLMVNIAWLHSRRFIHIVWPYAAQPTPSWNATTRQKDTGTHSMDLLHAAPRVCLQCSQGKCGGVLPPQPRTCSAGKSLGWAAFAAVWATSSAGRALGLCTSLNVPWQRKQEAATNNVSHHDSKTDKSTHIGRAVIMHAAQNLLPSTGVQACRLDMLWPRAAQKALCACRRKCGRATCLLKYSTSPKQTPSSQKGDPTHL